MASSFSNGVNLRGFSETLNLLQESDCSVNNGQLYLRNRIRLSNGN